MRAECGRLSTRIAAISVSPTPAVDAKAKAVRAAAGRRDMDGYRRCFRDWLGCAASGRGERPSQAAAAVGDGLLERVLCAGVAGHVGDFDDTFGVIHLSAAVAPAALVLATDLGLDTEEMLAAYVHGFEQMAAIAVASQPQMHERGWHPTSVCGAIGSATAAACLLGLDRERLGAAQALAALRAGGLQSAFGSDGKAIQVGMAAAAGVEAARLIAAGASVGREVISGRAGFEEAFDAHWAEPGQDAAVGSIWIKAYPCCIGTHSAIETALTAAAAGGDLAKPIVVAVHPVARRSARFDVPEDGLQAKFSIPFTVALTLLQGPPRPADFFDLDPRAVQLSRNIGVRVDPGLGASEAVLEIGGEEFARTQAPKGSPARPMSEAELVEKVRSLSGGSLDGAFEERGVAARDLLEAAGLNAARWVAVSR